MDSEQLGNYLKYIYKLEKSLHLQCSLLENINKKISTLQYQTKEDLLPLPNKPNCSINYCDIALISTIAGLLSGGIILSINIFIYIFSENSSNDLGNIFFSLILSFLIGFMVAFAIKYYNEKNKNKKIYQKYLFEKNEINSRNEEINQINELNTKNRGVTVSLLGNEYTKISTEINALTKTLNSYYDLDIIYPKYRNLVAMSSIYEYFKSGRTSTLEGHEGAYNIFENEVRLNRIITKLDDVIYNLYKIRDNQHMLYNAINSNNNEINTLTNVMYSTASKLKSLNNNAQVTAHHSKVSAENSQFQKYLSIFNSLR